MARDQLTATTKTETEVVPFQDRVKEVVKAPLTLAVSKGLLLVGTPPFTAFFFVKSFFPEAQGGSFVGSWFVASFIFAIVWAIFVLIVTETYENMTGTAQSSDDFDD